MKNILKMKNNFFLFLIVYTINISLIENNNSIFQIKISKLSTELEAFHIDTERQDKFCKQWVPSLLSPILVIPSIPDELPFELEDTCNINSPLFDDTFSANLYNFSFLDPQYNVTLAKEKISKNVDKCYFGLSNRLDGYVLKENKIILNDILNQLKNNKEINEKIFTFDKWNLNNDNFITSNLYFGQTNDNFKSGKGIIGSCESDINDRFWGCSFINMSLNDTVVELRNDTTNETYKIYFTSENHNIIIPNYFKDKFDELTNYSCSFDSIEPDEKENELSCSLFGKDDYFTIKLINGIMNITIEIDNLNSYTSNNDKKNKTRIRFEENDFFIFPLIMFKKFDIQFDAEKNLISFYTTDESILEVEKQKKKDKKESSTGLKIFLAILIIFLILGLVFAIFWFLKKRRGSIEKNINKYNKFEDEENFQDMNVKRVF